MCDDAYPEVLRPLIRYLTQIERAYFDAPDFDHGDTLRREVDAFLTPPVRRELRRLATPPAEDEPPNFSVYLVMLDELGLLES